MKFSIRRDQSGGGGHPLVATPLKHGLKKKKSKVHKNFKFLKTRFLNVLENSESIETNFFFKKIFPATPPPWVAGGGGLGGH